MEAARELVNVAGVALTQERVGALFPLLSEVVMKQRKAQTHLTRSSKARVSSLLSQMVLFDYRKRFLFWVLTYKGTPLTQVPFSASFV